VALKDLIAGGHQWKPGQSGNPAGKPRAKPLSELLRKAGDQGAYAEIVNALIARAKDGDTKAISIILDRIEGKVSDRLILEGSGLDLNDLLARKGQNADDAERPDDNATVSGGSSDASPD